MRMCCIVPFWSYFRIPIHVLARSDKPITQNVATELPKKADSWRGPHLSQTRRTFLLHERGYRAERVLVCD